MLIMLDVKSLYQSQNTGLTAFRKLVFPPSRFSRNLKYSSFNLQFVIYDSKYLISEIKSKISLSLNYREIPDVASLQ
jgi:hypothetical protein